MRIKLSQQESLCFKSLTDEGVLSHTVFTRTSPKKTTCRSAAVFKSILGEHTLRADLSVVTPRFYNQYPFIPVAFKSSFTPS